jgi:hypothetical protein
MNQYSSLESIIRKVMLGEAVRIEKDPADQISAGTYTTKNFEICPQAQKLYSDLPKTVNPDDAEKSAIFQDELFGLEKEVLARSRSSTADVARAKELATKIKHMAEKMNLVSQHSYVDTHVSNIEKHLDSDNTNTVDAKTFDINAEMRKRFSSPPYYNTKEVQDYDIDNTKFAISRNLKAQRKIKIIDND